MLSGNLGERFVFSSLQIEIVRTGPEEAAARRIEREIGG